jgi:DNA-binding NtrC family response regulator
MSVPNQSGASGPSDRESQKGFTSARRPVLVVAIDDDASMLDFYHVALSDETVRVECCTDPAKGLELTGRLGPDLVLLDLTMPNMNGLEVLRGIRSLDLHTQVVMVTGNYSIETAVESIRSGAADYICKPVSVEQLRALVERARQLAHRTARAEALEKELVEVFNLEGLIGHSPRILEIFELVQRIAPHFRTALVTGETGTGKELVAQALHKLSPRKNQRFAVSNCGALVDSLVESQLFGHRKGAFTGAVEEQVGLFEWADGGSVFLDEVGELSPAAQAKLLRVLENGEIQKLGSPQTRKVDVVVIAATSRDLNKEMKLGKFRPELWYRLNMVQVQLPPLRERKEDILLLARHFVDQFSQQYGKEIRRISRGAQNALLVYPWPGNVRELENALARACMLTQKGFIELEDLPPEVRGVPEEVPGTLSTLEEAEKSAIVRALEETKSKALAARMLGVSRATLYRLLEKYDLEDETPG